MLAKGCCDVGARVTLAATPTLGNMADVLAVAPNRACAMRAAALASVGLCVCADSIKSGSSGSFQARHQSNSCGTLPPWGKLGSVLVLVLVLSALLVLAAAALADAACGADKAGLAADAPRLAACSGARHLAGALASICAGGALTHPASIAGNATDTPSQRIAAQAGNGVDFMR